MIKKEIVRVGQIVFLYSQPPEGALIGLVDSIDYPVITILIIPRSEMINTFGKIQKIDISKDITLSILSEEFVEKYLTIKEKKYLKKLQKESEIVDLFAGMY